jgi:transcriptional regulator with XRE-family HTH domain
MDIDEHIAVRLKALRAERGWSLEQFAAASGVSRAMISRIERREASATAALLGRLCVALDVPLSELLSPAAGRSGFLTRKSGRSHWRDPATGFTRAIVSPRTGGSTVEVIEVELPPATQVDYSLGQDVRYSQHIVVLSGRLRVTQQEETELEPGDALFMTPAGRTRFHNRADRPCRYLVVVEHARSAR